MRPRRGFTLLECLIVGAILISLAAVLFPVLAAAGETAHVVAAASTVRVIREQIELHRVTRDGPMSPEGYPESIDPRWFKGGRLPSDPWTLKPINVQVVSGPSTAAAPNEVTFTLAGDDQARHTTAWYNSANGSFCMKVPDIGSEAEIRDMVARVNDWDGDSTGKDRDGDRGKGEDGDRHGKGGDRGRGKGKDNGRGQGRGGGGGRGPGRDR
jgi:type II secretory pathway pseudopilin PulG